MTEIKADYDQSIEASRVALGRGDRPAAEQALLAAVRAAEQLSDGGGALAAALIKLGELKHEAGAHGEAEARFSRALEVGERALGADDLGLVPALMSLGAVRIARGAPEQAEPVLTRALSIAERRLGVDHPDLVGLLNDLSRLYLKQSAYAFAEPLLLRLHAIKRSKGEDHPEVATVLASLAVVRQALGRHEAAEQLWRRVLEIRERTLAPNHFAIATAIEHLAETCSARGKIDESLGLLQRAVTMRELTLGGDHPSLRTLRERIADLRLQASDDGIILAGGESHTPSQWRPALSSPAATSMLAPISVGTFEPPRAAIEPKPALVEGPRAPQWSGSVRDAAPVAWEEPRSASLQLVAAGSAVEPLVPLVMPPLADDFGLDDDARTGDSTDEYRRAAGGSVLALFRRRPTPFIAAGVGVAAVAVLVVSLGGSSPASAGFSDSESATPATVDSPSGVVPSGADASSPDGRSGSGALDLSLDDAAASTTIPATSRPRPVPDRQTPTRSATEAAPRVAGGRAEDERGSANTPAAPVAPRISLPSLGDAGRGGSTAQLDSIMRSATAPVSARESFAPRQSSIVTLGPTGSSTTGSGSASFQPPQLVGALPRAEYPAALRGYRIQGEVVLEFTVDTLGRPDMSTLAVIRSPHDLFTAAARQVVPSIRFIPARAAGQKLRGAVQVPFVFSTDPSGGR